MPQNWTLGQQLPRVISVCHPSSMLSAINVVLVQPCWFWFRKQTCVDALYIRIAIGFTDPWQPSIFLDHCRSGVISAQLIGVTCATSIPRARFCSFALR